MADTTQPLTALQRGLQVADLTLRIKVRGHVVAQLQPHFRPTRMSRLLGLAGAEIYVMPGLRALFGRGSSSRSD